MLFNWLIHRPQTIFCSFGRTAGLWLGSLLYVYSMHCRMAFKCGHHLLSIFYLSFVCFLSYDTCSEAVPAQSHLSRKVSSAGTQSAVCRVRAGTAEQQRLLLKAAVLTPRAVGRKQVVHILAGAGAAYPES